MPDGDADNMDVADDMTGGDNGCVGDDDDDTAAAFLIE